MKTATTCRVLMLTAALTVLLSAIATHAFAQAFNFRNREASVVRTAEQIKTHNGFNDTIIVKHDKWDEMVSTGASWGSNLKFKSVHAFVKFYVNHAYPIQVHDPYTFQLTYRVYGYSDPVNPTTYTYDDDTLTISYRPDSLSAFQDIQYKKYSGFHKIMIVMTNLYKIDGAGGTPVLQDLSFLSGFNSMNFNVEGAILVQPFHKKVLTNSGYTLVYGPSAPALEVTHDSLVNDYLPVMWSVENSNPTATQELTPVNYELEWTYIDNYSVDPSSGEISAIAASSLPYDFKNNSTRIWLDTNYYQIPMVYQKGYLLYRVRMVRPDSIYFRYPIYGTWSLSSASGTVSSVGSDSKFQITAAHLSDSLNWQYTVSFAEQGRYKHVMSYYDGMLKNRQSITRFNSNPSRLIATEQVYDYEGRPSISLLPTPVNSLAFRYQLNLTLNNGTGLPYHARDFDSLNGTVCPMDVLLPRLADGSAAHQYYSPLNTDKSGFQKFVPDAGGYPFVQTMYSPGYDERVEKQGGAGDSLQIGHKHTIKNDYVSADQIDLNRLFGTNVGWSGFYRKTVSRDPNGQLSLNVTDYHGKTVTSSMIGIPDTLVHAIVPNENLPDTSYMEEDHIAGTTQQSLGNKIILDKNFFNDAAGNNRSKYEYSLAPFPTFCPDKYLSVSAHYEYNVFDECGDIVVDTNGILGTTGVLASGDTVSSESAYVPFFMEKGKHSIHKELTINTDDVAKAVDSFISLPITENCMHDEPWFIKETVLSKEFPCPENYFMDCGTCEGKKEQMIKELWPNIDSSYMERKYGIYSDSTGMVIGTDNSILTLLCGTSPGMGSWNVIIVPDSLAMVTDSLGNSLWEGPGDYSLHMSGWERFDEIIVTNGSDTMQCKYRYQDTCLVNLPASVVRFGHTYTNLQSLPVDTFIYIFNDTIAEALLPLHPEYCDLLNCVDDYYAAKLKSIPNAKIAEDLGLFYLSDMIENDPVYAQISTMPVEYPSPYDTLAYTYGGVLAFDTMALLQAYCNCGDSVMFTRCYAEMFGTEMNTFSLLNDYVKEQYFRNIRNLYIGSRNRYKFELEPSGSSGSCPTCIHVRMDIRPKPIFMPSFTSNTTVIPRTGNTMLDYLTLMNIVDADSISDFQAQIDSAQNLSDSASLALCEGPIDIIIGQLVNCADSATLAGVRDSLLYICHAGEVLYGNYTPQQIGWAITSNGITMGDLCNPYLVNYSNFMAPPYDANGGSFSCNSDDFFNDLSNTLDDADVLDVLKNTGTTHSYTLDNANQFEDLVADELGTTSASISSVYSSSSDLHTLRFHTGGDTVKIFFRTAATGSWQTPFNNAPGTTMNLGGFCTLESNIGDVGKGYVAKYAFAAKVIHTPVSPGPAQTYTMLAWSDRIQMSNEGENPLSKCVPCTKMKELYLDFRDTMAVYDVKGTDHPYYRKMLRNYMNLRLHKPYTEGQYTTFIESCALADSMTLPLYPFYFAKTFTTEAAVDIFIAALEAVDTAIDFTPVYYIKNLANTSFELGFDFSYVPVNKYKAFRDVVASFSPHALNENFSAFFGNTFIGWLFVPASNTTFDPGTDIFNGATGSFTFNLNGTYQLWNGTGFESFKLYNGFTPSATAYSSNSRKIDSVNRYLYEHPIGAKFFPAIQSTVGQEYHTGEKKAYLSYNYDKESLPVNRVLDTIQARILEARIGMFDDLKISYGHPSRPGNINNLYLADTTTATDNTHYDKLLHIVDKVTDQFSGALFFTGSNTQNISVPSGQLLTAYRCGDTAFWYRFFDNGDTLYNAFIRVPRYIDTNLLPGYLLQSIDFNLGEGQSLSFNVKLRNTGAPIEYLDLNGFTDFVVARNLVLHDVLISHASSEGIPTADTINNCERIRLNAAIYEGKVKYKLYVDSIRERLNNEFFAYLMNGGIQEKLFIGYKNQRFNYTLYHYDRAGNLMRTVPPAGVVFYDSLYASLTNGARSSGISVSPAHKKPSDYKYNSLNQVVSQETPDGGKTQYFYDAAGRAVFSQNAKQRLTGDMTYTLYDKQGRIEETGQAILACAPYFEPFPSLNGIASYSCSHYTAGILSPFPAEVQQLRDYSHEHIKEYVRSVTRSEVVLTVYDTAAITMAVNVNGQSPQDNLRKRVSCIRYYDHLLPGDSMLPTYNYAMHFSYDIAGNVKTLVRDYPHWKHLRQQFKRVDYDYDVISGKVNLLSYNRGNPDQYFQRYGYDADNRIVKVETSGDGYIWKRDAEYEYYQHGPLARMSLGDLRVQGVDYAYTIQGWLKAINGDLLDSLKDMGRDAAGNSVHAYDAVALTLDYFNGDYKPIGDSVVIHTSTPLKNLYNGNIPRATTALHPFPDLATRYTYDQLNRLVKADYADLDRGDATMTNTADYYSRYAYDHDGNLTKLVRNGNNSLAQLMDSLVYRYSTTAPINNKLQNVNDYAADNYTNDITEHTTTGISRYRYDATGNVVKDQVSGQDTIKWSHYNKVTDAMKDTLGNGMRFDYDGAGHRYMKTVIQVEEDTSREVSDYYVRDAQGNILATYKSESEYKMARSEWIEYITAQFLNELSMHEFLTHVIQPNYANLGQFQNAVVEQILLDEAYTNTTLGAIPSSFFVQHSPVVRSDFLSAGIASHAFYSSLRDFSETNDMDILAQALYEKTHAEFTPVANMITTMMGSGMETYTKKEVLRLMCEDADSLFMYFINIFAITYDTASCENNADAVYQAINSNPVLLDLFGSMVASRIYDSPTMDNAYLNFLKAICRSEHVMTDSKYVSYVHGAALEPYFRGSLATHASDSLFGLFADSYDPDGSTVRAYSSPRLLMETNYQYNMASLLEDYITSVDAGVPSIIYTGLEAIPWLTPSHYIGSFSPVVVLDSIVHHIYENVLQKQRISLSSHHLYGSSRLGTKDYLPDQYYELRDYSGPESILDTATLLNTRPWYSMEYNDNISALVQQPWGMTDVSEYYAGHQVGQKQYELTNHLGNVQATISDLPVPQGEYYVEHRSPALRSAYDYYPFGMLMPDRYVSDTTQNCITVSQEQWVTRWVDSCYEARLITMAVLGEGGFATPGAGFMSIFLPYDESAVTFEIGNLIPNVTQELSFDIKDVYSGSGYITVTELVNSIPVVLGGFSVSVKGTPTLNITPTQNTIGIQVQGPIEMEMVEVCVKVPQLIQQTMLVDICDEDKDRYRFGFNGQEKVNEWSGVGNHNTAMFWEYDTRTGRRLNKDPKSNPSWSTYSAFGGNPILYSDPLGDTIRFRGYRDKKNAPITEVEAQKIFDDMVAFLHEQGVADEYDALDKSTTVYEVYFVAGPKRFVGALDRDGNYGNYNPYIETDPFSAVKTTRGYILSPIEGFLHELAHGYEYDKNPCAELAESMTIDKQYERKAERTVITNYEQRNAMKIGYNYDGAATRLDHKGERISVGTWRPGWSKEKKAEKKQNSSKVSNDSNSGVKLNIGDGNGGTKSVDAVTGK